MNIKKIIKKLKRVVPERIDALDKNSGFPRSWSYHHIYRYNLTKKYCKNKIVLDVGCGYGYGSFILSKICKSIIGIDLSKKAIHIAKKNIHQRILIF